jgi:hypothetical protein
MKQEVYKTIEIDFTEKQNCHYFHYLYVKLAVNNTLNRLLYVVRRDLFDRRFNDENES